MKKYVLSFFVTLFSLFSVSACGAGDIGSPEYMASKQLENEVSSVDDSQILDGSIEEPVFSEGFSGLLECFEYNSYVIPETKTQTLADVIGALEGYRYKTKVGKYQFDVELYHFDNSNLSQEALNILNSINEAGYFNMLGVDLNAAVSSNFNYMMIYKGNLEDEDVLNHFNELSSTLKDFV